MKRVIVFRPRKSSSPTLNRVKLYIVMSLILFIGGIAQTAYTQSSMGSSATSIHITEGDEWYYYKGVVLPPRDWNSVSFDHGNWLKGPSGIGYGIGSNRTYLADMQNNYLSVYARREFTINHPRTVYGMNLSVVCDGPFIAYLNGIEIIRTNTIQMSAPDQNASAPHAEQYNISGFMHELFPGKNSLSVQCDNDDISSNDFSFIPFFDVLEKEEVQK